MALLLPPMLPMSLPSLGVNGARPLLESPVELAGLFRRAKGGVGILVGTGDKLIVGNIVLLLCRTAGAPAVLSIIDDRFESCPEFPEALLAAGERRAGELNIAVARARLTSPVAEVESVIGDGVDRMAGKSSVVGFNTVLLLGLVLVPLLVLLARLPLDVDEGMADVEPEPEPLIEVVTPFLVRGGRDVTLKEGVGIRCLMGMGAIGGSITFGTYSTSFSLPLTFLLDKLFRIPSPVLYSSLPCASLGSTFSHSSVIFSSS
jgi:hypothetical protein